MDGTTTVSTGEETEEPPASSAPPEVPVSGVDDPEVAFDALVVATQRSVLRAVSLIVGDGDRALDVVQDAYGRAYASWRRVQRLDAPGAWVRRVAIRQAVKVARRDHRRPGLEVVAVGRVGDGQDAVDGVDRRLDVAAALRTLPARQRAAVVLHHLEDRPVAEVAELLGCAESTARVHLHRGRRALASLLGEEDDHVR